MNYFIYTYIISLLTGRYELNKLTLLPMCGFIAQLVEHRTGIAEVTGSNPIEALIFFRLLLSSCLNWKIHCEDHSSLSSMTAVQIYELFHIYLHHYDICLLFCRGKPIVSNYIPTMITMIVCNISDILHVACWSCAKVFSWSLIWCLHRFDRSSCCRLLQGSAASLSYSSGDCIQPQHIREAIRRYNHFIGPMAPFSVS